MRPKGYIVEPESDSQIARREIIRENEEKGRVTKLEDLI